MKTLPVIVDGPGAYVTRDGRRVTIYRFGGIGTFNAEGHIWAMFRGELREGALS